MGDSVTVIAAITAAATGTVGLSILFVRSVVDYLNNRDRLRRDRPELNFTHIDYRRPNGMTFRVFSTNTSFDWKVAKIEVTEPSGAKCLAKLWRPDFLDVDWDKVLEFNPPVQGYQITIHPDYPEVWLTFVCRRTTWMWWERKRLGPKKYTRIE